jgi:hypothetical protein
MKTAKLILNNEDGYVIVVAILILALLTIIGTSSTQTTTVELQIVRNDLVHRDQLYRAEAAAMQAVQWIDNTAESAADKWKLEDLTSESFLSQNAPNLLTLNLDDTTWEMSGSDPDQNAGAIITGFRIVDETGPVDLGAETNMHRYTIYGLFIRPGSGHRSGESLIALGFKKRF